MCSGLTFGIPFHLFVWYSGCIFCLQDLPPHAHEVLEGTVTIVENGKPRNVWKTSLAGRYAPALCRAWDTIVKLHAPPGALTAPGVSVMLPDWQRWLMEASNHQDFPLLPSPTCPLQFTTGSGLSSCRVWGMGQRCHV